MRKSKWSMTLLTFVILVGMILTACTKPDSSSSGTSTEGNNSGENKGAADQILDLSLIADPPTMHPAEVNSTTSIIVLSQIFEGLTRLGREGEPELAAASDLQVSDDQTKYTFTLRDDAVWSNGDPVTAEDFAFAWKYQVDPKNADTPNAYNFYVIKGAEEAKTGKGSIDDVGITAVDDHTFEVQLKYPVPYFKNLIANAVFFPVNHKVAEANPDWALKAGKDYVTNGPFTLAEWVPKNKIVMKKFEDYWDADTVKLKQINMPIVTDANTEYKMYQQGELDFAGTPTGMLPLASIPALQKSGELQTVYQGGSYFYTFNTEKEPFNNKNIRKAFTYAIDRKAIVENITKAGEEPAMAHISPTIWDESEPYFKDNDVKTAKELLQKGLEELGYSSVDDLPAITLSYNTMESHAAIAQAIQDMWKKNLGVEVTLENNEWGVYLDRLAEGDYQVGRLGNSVTVADPYVMMEDYREPGGNNYTRWTDNKEFNELMEKSITETDPAKRTEILKQAETIFMDEMPLMPIYYYMTTFVHVKNLHDVVVRNGYIHLKWAYFE